MTTPFPRWLLLFGVMLLLASGLGVAIKAANFGDLSGLSLVDQERERARLLQTDRDFAAKSIADGPARAFAAYLTEDALLLPAGSGPIAGRQAIVERLQSGEFALSWQPQQAEVALSGDLGYTWGTYELRVEAVQGAARTTHGKYANVWRKEPDGAWRVVLDVGNENMAR